MGTAKIKTVLSLIVTLSAASIFWTAPAAAEMECQVRSSALFRYQSETVTQTVVAPGPQGCYRIFRMRGGWSIDNVALVSPSRNGGAAIRGFGYSYQPTGGREDSFVVRVSGADRNGRKGFSIIHVHILAQG